MSMTKQEIAAVKAKYASMWRSAGVTQRSERIRNPVPISGRAPGVARESRDVLKGWCD
jgi:hypothetical protein